MLLPLTQISLTSRWFFSGYEIFPDGRITGYYVNIDILNICFTIHVPFEGPEISASFSFVILIENKKAQRRNLSWFAENLSF